MEKRLLRNIPITNTKKEWICLAKRLDESSINYLVSAENTIVDKKKISIMYFYHKSNPEKAIFRVFLDKEDYITQDLTSESIKWKTGSLYNLLDRWGWYNECILVDNKSFKVLSNFLNTEEPLQALGTWQDEIKAKRLAKKHQVIKDRIDKKMKSVPKLPKSFEKWLNDTVLCHSRYVYYAYSPKKVLYGYCTHCQSNVRVEEARHNKQGICPNCKSSVTYKSIGRSGKIVDYGKAALIQKVEGNLLIRYFNVTKYYKVDYKNPTLEYLELQRCFVDKDGKIDSYEFRNFNQTGVLRWCEGISNNNSYSMFYSKAYDFTEVTLYTRNLSRVLKDSVLKYSGLKEFVSHIKHTEFPINSYINYYLSFPGLEYLVKLKLYKLVEDLLYGYYSYKDCINTKGINMHEILGINNNQLRNLQRINGGAKELKVLKGMGKTNLKLTDEQICFVAKHINFNNVVKASRYTTIHKMITYVTSQSKDNNINNTFSDWLDYIDFCKVLKYDLKNEFVLFPRHLTQSHNELSSLIADNKNELYNSRIAEMIEPLNRLFSWQSKDNVIIVPKTYDDILNEGNSLNHCVGKGSYGDKIIKGQSIILFLRNKKEIDKPFYTIELDAYTNKILQCRGKNNKSMDEEVKKIMKRFEKEKLETTLLNKAV